MVRKVSFDNDAIELGKERTGKVRGKRRTSGKKGGDGGRSGEKSGEAGPSSEADQRAGLVTEIITRAAAVAKKIPLLSEGVESPEDVACPVVRFQGSLESKSQLPDQLWVPRMRVERKHVGNVCQRTQIPLQLAW